MIDDKKTFVLSKALFLPHRNGGAFLLYPFIMTMVSITVKASEARRIASEWQALSPNALYRLKATQVAMVVIGVTLLRAPINVRNKWYLIIIDPTIAKISDTIKHERYKHFSSLM